MSFGSETQHIALPALMGAPAYARPPRPVAPVTRPLDPDDLPIQAEWTEEEHLLAAAAGWTAGSTFSHVATGRYPAQPTDGPQGRPLRLQAVAARLLR